MRRAGEAGGAAVLACLLALVASGCRPATESVDLLPLLREGAFIPLSDWADLRHGNRPLEEPLPEFWLTLPAVPQQGWGRAFRGWRPIGGKSTLTLRRRTAGSLELIFEFHRRDVSDSPQDGPITVTALLEGDAVGRLTLGERETRGRFPVPSTGEIAHLAFRFEPPISQPAAGPQEISLRSVGLVPAGGEPPDRDRMVSFDPPAKTVRFRHPGSLVTPLRLPPGALSLRLEIAGPPAADTPLAVYLLDAAGQRTDPSMETTTDGEIAADSSPLAGRSVFLVLEVAPAPARVLSLRHPVLEMEKRPAVRPAAAVDGGTPPESPPDVLLVVLDALRGDRLQAGPRRRALAPNLDRMASEAITFSRAWAECPTTSCSIPGLITGISFLPVGDVWRGPPLSDEVTTLAEYLRAAGYRTVGYSATPNNSARLNSTQGFDLFEELWGDHPHHGPYGLSELALQAIREQPEDQPLYLQLHYLPPHEPYDPPPRFDRFTDPGYHGPVNPSMNLRPFKEGTERLPPADLAQLVGLYDGNLLLADDAVGRVIDALKATDRWRRTLVVLTSDHGEAFMEHGLWGHNTTLYEEMLHVPLIVRLPEGGSSPGMENDTPASLVDVVPTVLGRLGLEPAPEVDGVDLLTPAASRDRPLFHRTSSLRWPQLAVRSASWKLIAWPRLQRQELYDLAADSGETRNLAADRPILYAGLGLLARRHLERTLLRTAGGEEVEPSAEEAAALRALGYLH